MSTLEDRLEAALAARAELVRPEDLGHRPLPAVAVPLHRRPGPWLVAAAACVVVALPFVVGVGGGDDRPAPPVATPTSPVVPNGDLVDGADWPTVHDYDLEGEDPAGFDVDGDGVRDHVLSRTRSGKDLTNEPWRVEVRLSSGGTTAALLDHDSYDVNVVGPADLDGDGADELVYGRGTETGEIGVLRYSRGALVDLAVPDEPGLTHAYDARGRIRAWWRADGALTSSRSVAGGFVPGDGGKPLPSRYEVQVWRWAVEDDRLRPVSEGVQCVESLQESRPFPCEASGPGPLPGTQPEATEAKRVAEPFTVELDGDDQPETVALEGPTGPATVEEGEVLLMISLGAGGELSAPVPAGWTPDVVTTPFEATDGTRGLLLRQEGGDATPMTLYLVRDGELVALRPSGGVRFGNGFDVLEDSSGEIRTDTYLTSDGRLLSRTASTEQLDDDRWQFLEWLVRGDRLVVEESYGVGCWVCE